MKNLIEMDYKIALKKINFLAALLLVMFLPFSRQWITYFIAFWVLTWIMEGDFKIKKKELKNWKLWFPIIIVLINIISITYSKDILNALSIIQVQISIILLPLVLNSVNSEYKRKKQLFLLVYLIGVFILSIVLVYNIVFLNHEIFFKQGMNLRIFLETASRFSPSYDHRSYLSLHLCLAIIFSIYLVNKSKRNYYAFMLLIIFYSFVIIILNSRAALITLVLMILYFLAQMIRDKKQWLKILIFTIAIVSFSYLILQSRLSSNISWIIQYTNSGENTNNLYSNGNFREDMKYWEYRAPDTIFHEVVDTRYGKAIRIKRNTGKGYWSLKYTGRQIYYYKSTTYTIRFKYRVIKGSETPFNVGWAVKENGKYLYDLDKNIRSLDQGWNECIVQYMFNSDYSNPISFLNSQLPNTILDITDIELTCDDSLNRPMYVDQLKDIRLLLWGNALTVWKESPIFGHGIGDSKYRLVEIHEEQNIDEAVNRKYNCHNQFLETATQTGIIGLVILLLVFAVPFYHSIKKKQELLFLFLMICFINFMFETMLHRLAGVVFFAFWYSFLWFVYYKEDSKIEDDGK
jgi:hypothetical protein